MKVALYVRVSTQRQALTQTIDQQLQCCRSIARRRDGRGKRSIFFVMMGTVARACTGLASTGCGSR